MLTRVMEHYEECCRLTASDPRNHHAFMAYMAGVHLILLAKPDRKRAEIMQQEATTWIELGIYLPNPELPTQVSCYMNFKSFCEFTPCPENMANRKMFMCGVKLGLSSQSILISLLTKLVELSNDSSLFDIY